MTSSYAGGTTDQAVLWRLNLVVTCMGGPKATHVNNITRVQYLCRSYCMLVIRNHDDDRVVEAVKCKYLPWGYSKSLQVIISLKDKKISAVDSNLTIQLKIDFLETTTNMTTNNISIPYTIPLLIPI